MSSLTSTYRPARIPIDLADTAEILKRILNREDSSRSYTIPYGFGMTTLDRIFERETHGCKETRHG